MKIIRRVVEIDSGQRPAPVAPISDHNALSGLQGGTTAEYYHLTAAEHTALLAIDPADFQPIDDQLTDIAGLSYSSNALKVVRVNAGENAFELASMAALFQPIDTQLTDLAALTYAGNTGKVLAVNGAENGIEWIVAGGGGGLSQPQVMARACGC